MRLIMAQGTPVVPSRVLDSITDEAEFFLQINLGHHYAEGSSTEVVLKRHGRTDFKRLFPTPRTPSAGLLRLLWLPYVDRHYLKVVEWAIAQWPDETREACFIGRLWLPFLGGLKARRLGKVRRSVYWVNDFFPATGRLEDRLLNSVFQAIDRHCCRKADIVWHLTKRIYDVHSTADGKRITGAPERIVPCLYDPHPEAHAFWSPDRLHNLVYMGLIKRGMGLEVILPALATARRQIPDLTLDIVGEGPDLELFRQTARDLKLDDATTFHGYVKDESAVHRIVARSAAGLALYDPASIGHSYYTLTSKVHMYVGCGTPVLVTESAGSYDYVMQGNAGLRVEYTADSVADGILKMCSAHSTHDSYRNAACALAGSFGHDRETLLAALRECTGVSQDCW